MPTERAEIVELQMLFLEKMEDWTELERQDFIKYLGCLEKTAVPEDPK